MKLTREKAIKLFRAHWKWLSENPDKNKADWPGHDFYKNPIYGECFLCEYCNITIRKISYNKCIGFCDYCPIQWPGNYCQSDEQSDENTGLYELWLIARQNQSGHQSQLALQISQLPEKEE